MASFFIIESRELSLCPHPILEGEWVYLLEKCKTTCTYCGTTDVGLEKDLIEDPLLCKLEGTLILKPPVEFLKRFIQNTMASVSGPMFISPCDFCQKKI